MYMKRIPQRLRTWPILPALVLGLVIFTISGLSHRSLLPTSVFRAPSPAPAPAPAPAPPPAKDVPKKPKPDKPSSPSISRPKLEPDQCSSPEAEFLRRRELGLTDTVVYTRRCIKPVASRLHGIPDRDVTSVDGDLFTGATTLNLTTCSHPELPPCEPLTLHVPPPYPATDASHIVFGVASKHDRMRDSIPAFAHWLAGTGAHLVGIIVDADDSSPTVNLTALEAAYSAHGMSVTFSPPKLKQRIQPLDSTDDDGDDDRPVPVEHHHFMLIREMLAHANATAATTKTEWLGVLDDDTFFPSLHPLVHALGRHDPSLPLWLGQLSEAFSSVKHWGMMAYGGAGVFLTRPLAAQLEPLLESCIRTATVDTGDGILRDCVYTRTRTKLTLVPGLYQHDVRGDLAGFFESGVRPVLSLHHWKSWYREPVPAMAAVARLCGDCFLQRWRFAGDDVLLANGYSVVRYPRPGVLAALDLERMEGTWSHAGHDMDFSLGPMRPRLAEGDKMTYKLVEVRQDEAFRQLYVYKDVSEDVEARVDEVIELVWEV